MVSSRLSLFVLGLFFMQQPVVRVGEWLVTPSVNQISRKGRQLTLEPRLIDLLVFFARHPGEVLSRDELIDNVWTRNVVTSHVVTQSVSELRKSLKDGDDGSLEYIATVPKRGYKLTVPVIWWLAVLTANGLARQGMAANRGRLPTTRRRCSIATSTPAP